VRPGRRIGAFWAIAGMASKATPQNNIKRFSIDK